MTSLPTHENIQRQVFRFELEKEFIREGAFESMPKMLRDACNVFQDKQDREVFLMGALPVCAALMRGAHVMTNRGKKGLNVGVWVWSSFSVGKGIAGMAKLLLTAVRSEAKDRYQSREQESKHLTDRYNAEYRFKKKELDRIVSEEYQARKERDELAMKRSKSESEKKRMAELNVLLERCIKDKPDLPAPPDQVPSEDIVLPLYGNVKTIRDSIADNEGHILFFDTEADSLQMKSGEYGDLGQVIKQGIENEDMSQIFKTTGLQEWRPYISLMIGATDNQLLQFIKGPHDGLFSRFLYYGFEGTDAWKSQRPGDGPDFESQLLGMQARFAQLYDAVKEAKPTVNFTQLQWDDHDATCEEWKIQAVKTHSAMGGCINRLGHFQLRIAATFAIMRAVEAGGTLGQELRCDNDSWTAAKLVAQRFLRGLYDTWDLYKQDQLPTDRRRRDVEHDKARVLAATEAQRLKESENRTLAEIHDIIIAAQEFTPFTVTWCGNMDRNAKKQRVSRLLTFLQA